MLCYILLLTINRLQFVVGLIDIILNV